MTLNLVLCLLVSAAALYYVFNVPPVMTEGPAQTRVAFLRERKEAVYENIRDLNFEYNAGKVPDADYHSMKSSLEDEAAAILAEITRLESGDRNHACERKA
jgi:hypothetical protein